jgi:hypothetical protein
MRRVAVAVLFVASVDALPIASAGRRSLSVVGQRASRVAPVSMGLFDGLKKAFENEEFKEDDQRVRASHILCKGDDDIERISSVMQELGERVQAQPDSLSSVFAELARRESECSSSSMGGDLGTFGPGKMVPEFDAAYILSIEPARQSYSFAPLATAAFVRLSSPGSSPTMRPRRRHLARSWAPSSRSLAAT